MSTSDDPLDICDAFHARLARPAPTLEELRSRPPRVSLEPLVVDLPVLEEEAHRGATEVVATPDGICVQDARATNLAVFSVPDRGPPALLGEAAITAEGLRLRLPFATSEPQEIVAISTGAPIDIDQWGIWLEQVLDAGPEYGRQVRAVRDRVRFGRLRVYPPVHAARVRVQAEKLPPMSPEVGALISAATTEARAEHLATAANLYQQALRKALVEGDHRGRVIGALGLSKALGGMGLIQSADAVLDDLLTSTSLDAGLAAWVYSSAVGRAVDLGEIDEAGRWLAQARELKGGIPNSMLISQARYLMADARPANALRVLDRVDMTSLPKPAWAGVFVRLLQACTLADLGRIAAARGCLTGEGLELPEQHLFALRARTQVDHAAGAPSDWAQICASAAGHLAPLEGRPVPSWCATHLVALAHLALDDDAAGAAWTLLRLRFLESDQAQDPSIPALFVAGNARGLLACGPDGAIRRLTVGRAELHQWIADASWELRHALPSEALRRLRDALGQPEAPDGLLVECDGALAGAPLPALLATPARIPAVRVLAGARRIARGGPPAPGVASFADVAGDLPLARREVAPEEAQIHCRGADVTRSTLAAAGDVGLLHIAVHAERERGVPALMLADGPLTPTEIAELNLSGAPVVLLAGCGTAPGQVGKGTEQSLAAALRVAGASAVIATLWPVPDADAHRFVRAFIAGWPTTDPAQLVADICQRLRVEGAPARCWAAFSVY